MKFKKQSGQVLIGTAVAMVVLAGFAGLAIDMGTLRYQKRLQQTAADGAAIAGASNLGYNGGSGVLPAAQTSATDNGFTDGGGQNLSNCAGGAAISTICVQVLNPPQDVSFNGTTILGGPHSSNVNYVEVLVAEVHPTYFMKIFGIASKTIFARAVATNLGGNTKNTGCLYTLGGPTNAIEGVNINGSVIVNATTCGIVDNGNFNTKGNKLIVNAGTFGIAGDVNASGPGGDVTCIQTPTLACPTPNMPASGDPLSKLVPPCSPCTGGSAVTVNSNTTLNPGTYSSISIGPATVTFNPGLYIIDCAAGCNVSSNPGLQVSANSIVQGNGVTFYLTNGATVGMTGEPTVQLTAPDNSGQYPGILFYQDPADTNGPSFGGNSSSFYDGVLYFPSSQITFYGNNNSIAVAMVVSKALAFSGNPTVNLQGAAGLPTGVNLVTNAVLVE
jgi:hypothetical protein